MLSLQVSQEQCRWSALYMTVVHLHHWGAKLKRQKRTVGTGKLFCEIWTNLDMHSQTKRKFAYYNEPMSDGSVSNDKSSAPFLWTPRKREKTKIFSLWNVCQGVKNLLFSTDKPCVLATVLLTSWSLFRQAHKLKKKKNSKNVQHTNGLNSATNDNARTAQLWRNTLKSVYVDYKGEVLSTEDNPLVKSNTKDKDSRQSFLRKPFNRRCWTSL